MGNEDFEPASPIDPEQKSIWDRKIPQEIPEILAEVKEQRESARKDTRERKARAKLLNDAWDNPELRAEAMQIAELRYPTPDWTDKIRPDWTKGIKPHQVSKTFQSAQNKLAKEYLERATFGVTKKELEIQRKNQTEQTYKESLADIRERLMRDYGVANPNHLTETDIPKQQMAFKEADKIFNSKENKITKAERIKQDRERANEKIEDAQKGLEDNTREAEPGADHSRETLDWLKERRIEDAQLSNLEILREDVERVELNPTITQEIKRNLARIGLEVAQAQHAKNDTEVEQERLISAEEEKDSAKWKQYINDLVATYRNWRQTKMFGPSSKWQVPAKFGKLRLAIFDELNGNVLKNMGDFATQESNTKRSQEAMGDSQQAVENFQQKVNAEILPSSDHLVLSTITRIKRDNTVKRRFNDPATRYSATIDIVEPPKEKTSATHDEDKSEQPVDIHWSEVLNGEEAERLVNHDASTMDQWREKIRNLFSVHTTIFLAKELGTTLSRQDKNQLVEAVLQEFITGLQQEQEQGQGSEQVHNQNLEIEQELERGIKSEQSERERKRELEIEQEIERELAGEPVETFTEEDQHNLDLMEDRWPELFDDQPLPSNLAETLTSNLETKVGWQSDQHDTNLEAVKRALRLANIQEEIASTEVKTFTEEDQHNLDLMRTSWPNLFPHDAYTTSTARGLTRRLEHEAGWNKSQHGANFKAVKRALQLLALQLIRDHRND